MDAYLIPWILDNSAAACKKKVMDPPAHIEEDTRRVVATMTNGGLELPQGFLNAEQAAEQLIIAEGLCRAVHKATEGHMVIKSYLVKDIKEIKGTYRPSSKGATSKLENSRQR